MAVPSRFTVLSCLLLFAAACPSELPHPAVDATRHLCCNLRYERTTISDVNYQRGTLIPYGTPVRITRVTRKGVVFEAPGYPPITLLFRYGRRVLTLDDYLERVLQRQDPRPEVARRPLPIREAITQGRVVPGMTRADVLHAIGHPPVHRTPSLGAPEWRYWQNRWEEFVVRFDGDRVTAIGR